jgi:hypothetical protein
MKQKQQTWITDFIPLAFAIVDSVQDFYDAVNDIDVQELSEEEIIVLDIFGDTISQLDLHADELVTVVSRQRNIHQSRINAFNEMKNEELRKITEELSKITGDSDNEN